MWALIHASIRLYPFYVVVFCWVQATSKASSAEEMQRACTYGFRGEALYSLGLTSMLEIQSRCVGEQSHAKVRHGVLLLFEVHAKYTVRSTAVSADI